jgi:hypothetical protein
MSSQSFTVGRIRRADYDASLRRLDLAFDDGRIRSYRNVPAEVYRRLCQAPNAATFWEDRIAEEYPESETRQTQGAEDGRRRLDDLFNR